MMKNIFNQNHYPYITINKTKKNEISNICKTVLDIRDARENLFDEIIGYDALVYNFVPVECNDEQIIDWLSDDDIFGFEYTKNNVKYSILAIVHPFEYRLFVDDETKEVSNYYNIERADNLQLVDCVCGYALVKVTRQDNVEYAIANIYFHASRDDDITSDIFHMEVDTNAGNCNEIGRMYHQFVHNDNRIINGVILENQHWKKTHIQPVIKIIDTKYQCLSLVKDIDSNQYYFVYEEPKLVSGNRIAKPFWTSTKGDPELTKVIWDMVFDNETVTVKSERIFDYFDQCVEGELIDKYTVSTNAIINHSKVVHLNETYYDITEVDGSVRKTNVSQLGLSDRVKLKLINVRTADNGKLLFDISQLDRNDIMSYTTCSYISS